MTIASLSRRHLLSLVPAAGLAGWALLSGCTPDASDAPAKEPQESDPIAGHLAGLERQSGGRLGVAFLDSASGRTTGHRTDERFALCSTFKWPLSAVVLKAIDDGKLTLDRRIPYGKADLLPNSSVTESHVGKGGMTVGDLMEATITTSDNAAANLLLPLVGGPDAVTRQFRAWGDPVTRLDRLEPHLNRVGPDEVRDTTTPAAMAALLRTILLGDALSPASRTRLVDWGLATTTGTKRLRAGLPAGWRIGHKTGTAAAPGMMNKYNDIAVAFPPQGAPLLIAAYYEGPVATDTMRDEDEAVLAAVARLAAEWAEGRSS
ncbi:class A beta-lactamase [Sphingopyxis panaciterrulae]|uniref:Beta-lactamase n=1 Tax=Sphingopyxis panaciterrulae TaxID=462372 RepID=A0A7W9B586_9SPHN|nr:class A beta-lactamase [Sphingopyxis panaciterrulae]MBB5706502.1 beta-lactamase class A [Sphingopyxis panaciterrulae]